MYAVCVLACTLQLTTFSLQCNLSEPDMPSLNQCGKLLNTTSFKQGAIVPAGKGTRRTVSLAAALQRRQLPVIQHQNGAGCSSQLHQHNPPELWLLKRPRDGVLPRPVAQHEEEKEMTGNMGWPQCFKGPSSSQFSLCCFTLFVLS